MTKVVKQIALRDTQIIITCSVATVLLIIYPVCHFLLTQWDFRRERLFGFLAAGAIKPYYKQFRPGSSLMRIPLDERERLPQEDYMNAFQRDFYLWYGRRHYAGALILLAIITAGSAYWSIETLRQWSIDSIDFKAYRTMTASALAGGFAWVIFDELGRIKRRDFVVSDIYYYSFRLLVCIPFGVFLSAFANPTVGIPLAFLLGAFPTASLFTIGRRIASQQLKLGDDPASGSLELQKLQAVSRASAERFNDEGIDSIAALARVDPIDITIRTNFDLAYVVRCISQALSFTYLGESANSLVPLAMQDAREISRLIGWLENEDYAQAALKTIAEASAKLKISETALDATLRQIASNPYTKLLTMLGA